MLKVDRKSRTLSRLEASSLADAQILERTDLQECIYNSSDDFFAEIGERVFVIGKEVAPSQTVQDRIDLLGIDAEGTSVIVELKRGSNKLQMLQAISYAGMVARWDPNDFRGLVSEASWEQLTDFLDVDVEEINRRQRLLLVAEGYDYALLAGAEWLSEQNGVDIRCSSVSFAADPATGAEYLACTSIFPPPALAEQAAARNRTPRASRPLKWGNWEEALSCIDNEALESFAREELEAGRESYLRRRGFHYRLDGKRRWSLYCRRARAYVWQRGRFPDDVAYWMARTSESASVKPVKGGSALSFNLWTEKDLHAFREAATTGLASQPWTELGLSSRAAEDDDESE